jgi:hypothetical protein
MDPANRRWLRLASRELSVAGIAGLSAWLFLIHPILYLNGAAGHDVTAANLLVTTAVLYVTIRLIFIAAAMYFVSSPTTYVVCPQCGRAIQDGSPRAIARHHRIAVTPKPTEQEVLAAVMLRKAIDDARRVAGKSLAGPPDAPALPGDFENPPISVDEFERILRDLDLSRSGGRSQERRPKGPAPPSG